MKRKSLIIRIPKGHEEMRIIKEYVLDEGGVMKRKINVLEFQREELATPIPNLLAAEAHASFFVRH